MSPEQLVSFLRKLTDRGQSYQVPDGEEGGAMREATVEERLFTAARAFAELDRMLSHGAEMPYQWSPGRRYGEETEVEIAYWRGR